MKSAIRILLVFALAAGPWGCNRADAPNESVSANADKSANADQAEQTKQAAPQQPPTKKLTPPAPPATATKKAPVVEPEPRPAPAAPAARARATATVPAGTALTVVLANGLSTETAKAGDTFVANLSQPLVVNGKVVAEKGAKLVGHVKTVDEPGRVKGRAQMALVLDNITVNDRKYNIDSEPFTVAATDNKERDAGIIAGGAGVGAVIGAVAGGKKGAALGAIIGGGGGTTAVLITKGDHVNLEPETRINFVVSRDLDLPVIRSVAS
jgi:hypothetical protein